MQMKTLSLKRKNERERLQAFARLVEQELHSINRLENLGRGLSQEFYNPLPGKPERCLNKEHLKRVLETARSQRTMVAIVHLHVLDLEELIATHDSAAGDTLLKNLYARLQTAVRGTDIIGRNGADRFLIFMAGMRTCAEIAARVRQIMLAISNPVPLGEDCWQVKLSAGVSCFPDDADSVEVLLDRARTASRRTSREAEQTTLQFYSRHIHLLVSRRHNIAQRLAAALKDKKLQQVYQPIVALNNGRLVGVEALARWNDAHYGPISPAEFVPLAEENPSMRRALTRWALHTACRQAAEWKRLWGVKMRIAVNIPGAELCRKDFLDLVRATLKANALPAYQLHLELTEQSLIANIDAAIAAMHALREDGVQFSVDDFGTGYSSLSYLRKLPLDALKIDRSFIADVASDALDHDLTRGIVEIARALNLHIIAEGVETEAQLEALNALRCNFAQGYLFSHPIPAEQVSRQLLHGSTSTVLPVYPQQTPVSEIRSIGSSALHERYDDIPRYA